MGAMTRQEIRQGHTGGHPAREGRGLQRLRPARVRGPQGPRQERGGGPYVQFS